MIYTQTFLEDQYGLFLLHGKEFEYMAIGADLEIAKISLGTIPIAKISLGDTLIYSAGNTVTYYVDTDVVYHEEVDADETVLSPKTFIPEKAGWIFVGWRQDTTASEDVLRGLAMGDDPIELYAVFQKNITLSYNGNGGTGSMSAETKQQYYNNGIVANPTFTVKQKGSK